MRKTTVAPTPMVRAITGPRSLRDPRSREYAIQTMRSLKRYLEGTRLDAQGVERELREIEHYEHWRVLGHRNLDAYLRAEIGASTKALRRRLAQTMAADADQPPLAKHGEVGRGRNRVANSHSNSRTLSSTSAERLVRRLKRDAPTFADALARGEYPSARAAAMAAGLPIRPTATIRTDDLTRALRVLLKHFSAAAIRQALDEIAPDA
jgi:hypothetical protein